MAKAKTKATQKLAKGAKPDAKKGRRLHVRADLSPGGSLHVRHHQMSDGERDIHLEGLAVTLADDEAKPVWIQLAKPGTFRGHPAGPFELNDKVFAEIIANFKATENRSIPIDFEHATEAEPTAGSIPSEGAPAQGWIVDLKVQGGCLYGLVEWGEKAREYIRTKKYKFFSPAIRFGARDRVTGKQIGARMTSGGLTNNPFLDGMRPLAAKDAALHTPNGDLSAPPATTMRLAHSPTEYMPQLRYLLRMSDLSTAQEVADQLERLREHFEAAGEDPDATHEGIELRCFLYPLRNMLGATLGMTWDDVFDRIAALIADAIGDTDDEEEAEEAELRDSTTQNEAGTAGMSTTPDVSVTPDQKDDAMSAEKIAELSTKNTELSLSLKDASTKLSTTETKLTEAEAKLADVSLSLKDEKTKRETAEVELKTLRDEKTARETKDLNDRVTLAFDTYKDAQKLTEDDKESMLLVLKNRPESFEKKYPKVAPAQQHLLKNLTEARPGGPPPVVVEDGGVTTGKPIDLASAARALSAQRGIPLGEAQRIVARGMPRPAAR